MVDPQAFPEVLSIASPFLREGLLLSFSSFPQP